MTTITVDGQRREEPWTGVRFVACGPGTHMLELEWSSHTIGGHRLTPLKKEITVDAGRVTELVYTVQTAPSHGPPAASLTVKGTLER